MNNYAEISWLMYISKPSNKHVMIRMHGHEMQKEKKGCHFTWTVHTKWKTKERTLYIWREREGMKEARKSTKIHGKVGTYICFSCKIFGGGEVICIGVWGIFPLVFWWFWQRFKASLCRRSRRAFAIFSSIKEKKSSTQLPWLCFSFSFLASIQLPCHITLFLVSHVRIVNLLPLHAIGSRPYQFMSKQKHYR